MAAGEVHDQSAEGPATKAPLPIQNALRKNDRRFMLLVAIGPPVGFEIMHEGLVV